MQNKTKNKKKSKVTKLMVVNMSLLLLKWVPFTQLLIYWTLSFLKLVYLEYSRKVSRSRESLVLRFFLTGLIKFTASTGAELPSHFYFFFCLWMSNKIEGLNNYKSANSSFKIKKQKVMQKLFRKRNTITIRLRIGNSH